MKNKFLMILLAAALSFAMWFYVVTVVNPEYEEEFSVPVVLDGQTMLSERGLMVTENLTPTVKVALSGNRTDLTKLSSSNIKVIADLSKTTETGEIRLNYSVSIASDNTTGAIQVVKKEPQYISLNVEREKSAQIDIKVNWTGAVPEDFIADTDNAVLEHERISVSGPEPIIDQIAEARIDVELTGRNASFSEDFHYTLYDINGQPLSSALEAHVEKSVTDVNVTLKIQRTKKIPLVLTIIEGGGATAQTSDITINPAVIEISGSDQVLEGLTELNIGTINLGEHTTSFVEEFEIVLPKGVTNLSNVTKANVMVQFPDLLTRTFTVTRINAINIPEGLEVNFLTQEYQVTVRGPKELITRMTASDINVTVDFSNAQLGKFSIKPTITMSALYSQAGAVEVVSVNVELKEATEDEA